MPTYPKGVSPNTDWLRARVAHDGNECLIWPFSVNWNGYGHLKFEGKMTYAHRAMCHLVHGEPPTPKHVAAHSCNNGHLGCVHPDHISWKTPSQNLIDRRAAGTITKKRWTNKGTLSAEQIAQIISLKGTKNQREIGAMFGISYQHVSVVQNRKLRCQAP